MLIRRITINVTFTIKCQLVAIQEGQYTVYVFDNLNHTLSSIDKYIMCTKLPNWQYNTPLNIGDVGYLQYEYAEAGTLYYDHSNNTHVPYKYSNFYFLTFIKETPLRDETNKDYKF